MQQSVIALEREREGEHFGKMAASANIKITVRGKKDSSYSFLFETDFTYDELVQAFPAATALAYSDGDSEKIVITATNGIFKTPLGGWTKEGRTFYVIEGNTVESDREQKVKDMIKAIREQKKLPKSDSRRVDEKGSNLDGNLDSKEMKRKHNTVDKYTRSRNPKIHIGWQHYKSTSFKQVFKADGGSVRQLPLETLDMEISDVVRLGTDTFYPEGKSKYGNLQDMEVFVADASGQRLSFETIEENKPNLGNYLKSNGLQLSKHTFYLMSKKKENFPAKHMMSEVTKSNEHIEFQISQLDKSEEQETNDVLLQKEQAVQNKFRLSQLLLPVDQLGIVREKQKISIKFCKERHSKYSDELSIISCNSIRQCIDITSFDEPVPEDGIYNPCTNGFSICKIEIGGKTFLETDFDQVNGLLNKKFRYPSAKENVSGMIIHEPLEIWGYDENRLVIGVVIGTSENVEYKWFRNNVTICSGSMNIIVITEPGLYSCEVSIANLKQVSKAVQVIALTDFDERNSSINANFTYEDGTKQSSDGDSNNSSIQEDGSTDADKVKDVSFENKMSTLSQPSFAVPEVAVEALNIDYSSVLGTGAFGTVYKGKWTGSDVAVKAIPIPKRAKNAMLRTVEKEITINSKLRHPNIIQFLAVARTCNKVYLVHEFIKGCNMEDAIFNEDTKVEMAIDLKGKLYIMTQVVQALSYMHSLVPVVLHQDIKPGNVLIKQGCLTTKVCDMGISRLKSVGAATTTAVGTTCGSPAYMAPECLIQQKSATQCTDIWSIGVTFVEFFSEKEAWSVDDELDPVSAIKSQMKNKISPMNPTWQIPNKVAGILKMCIDYDSAERPTAEQILQQLV